jgi:hypothetical protein
MTNISLREIVKENWRVVARLSDQLNEEQRRFVAHNAISMLDYQYDQDTLISFVPAIAGARALYEQLGFKDTGIVEDGELVFRLDLD